MYLVYILKSEKDGRTYAGYTDNLERRVAEHSTGKSAATRYRRPLKLLFAEQFENRAEAKARELWWKSSVGRKHLRSFF